MVRNINMHLSPLYRSSRENIKKETLNLNAHLIARESGRNICTFYSIAPKFPFLWSIHINRTFPRIDQMPGHKKVFRNPRRLKSYQVSFPTTMVWKWNSVLRGIMENSRTLRNWTTSSWTTNAYKINQKGNFKNLEKNWKPEVPKLMEYYKNNQFEELCLQW